MLRKLSTPLRFLRFLTIYPEMRHGGWLASQRNGVENIIALGHMQRMWDLVVRDTEPMLLNVLEDRGEPKMLRWSQGSNFDGFDFSKEVAESLDVAPVAGRQAPIADAPHVRVPVQDR